MEKNLLYLIDLKKVELAETADGPTGSWVHALPVGEYKHPVFGKMNFSADRIKRFAEGVKAKIRGVDPSINYNHNNQDDAAGWVKDGEARDDGLWLFVEWTNDAVKKIKDGAYRYFSSEFHDKWTDPTGKVHEDVVFGGALTNRPFMKNLLPVNLSEDAVDSTLELAEAIRNARTQAEGEDVNLKKFNELLGLPADTKEEDTLAKLAELVQKPVPTGNPISEELKQLAEQNPMVSALIRAFDDQGKTLTSLQDGLIEAEITKKLNEFDNTQILLTPVAKDKVHDFLKEAPTSLHEKFWDIMGLMRSSSGLLVELGERGGTTVRYGNSKDAVTLFMDEAARFAKEHKITLDEAMTRVSQEQPQLWEGYRTNSYAFRDQQ